MKYINKSEAEAELLLSIVNGQWGTVGPRFFQANQAIAEFAGVKHALVTFSASAALETVLRSKNIGFGDEVIVAGLSDPVDSMTAAAAGAAVVFAEADENKKLTRAAIEPLVNWNTRAVIADLPADAAALSDYCREKGIYFIVNSGDAAGLKGGGIPAHKYADAAFFDMSQGCALNSGLAGAVITDSEADFNLFYAYHNCGRPVGDGATLSFDEIIGGDMRVAEFQAALIPGRLAQLDEIIAEAGEDGISGRTVCVNMAEAPFWKSDAYRKLTGK